MHVIILLLLNHVIILLLLIYVIIALLNKHVCYNIISSYSRRLKIVLIFLLSKQNDTVGIICHEESATLIGLFFTIKITVRCCLEYKHNAKHRTVLE